MIDIKHPKYGFVSLCFHPRAKRITIRVTSQGKIKVSLPRQATQQEALEALQANEAWLDDTLNKLSATSKHQDDTCQIDKNYTLQSHFFSLRLQAWERKQLAMNITKNEVILCYNKDSDLNSSMIQRALKTAISTMYRHEAQYYLPIRLQHFAKKYKLNYNIIRIKKLKSRWGSCSSLKNINFNLYLMSLPLELIDLVIAHELCHLTHLNHGKDFHQMLEQMIPGKKELEQQLKTYRIP